MNRSVLLIAAVAWTSSASAAPFDDCILKNMRGVTSDTAARAVQTACLRTAEAAIPGTIADSLNSGANAGYDKDKGFFLELENRSPYTITSVTVSVFSKAGGGTKYYPLDYFEPEGVSNGSIFIKDYFAPEFHSIQPGQKLTFRIPIAEKAASAEDFAERYVWRITAARGLRRGGKQ